MTNKEKIIFSYVAFDSNPETLILPESIRKFAGKFSQSKIWMFIPNSKDKLKQEVIEKLSALEVEIIPFTIDLEILKFPFTSTVCAAAEAEKLALGKTEFLVRLGTNSIVIKEPKHFLLEGNKNLGYRPVHHTLIGSIFDEPIDEFWKCIYEKTNVKEENIFPMQTHVDGKILRPYFNSGFLIVRPERGLFKEWWNKYKELYKDPKFKKFYKKDDLYVTFIHQAVLSGVILSKLENHEIQELPFEYNYPLNLYFETSEEYLPNNINDLVTARYYLNKLTEGHEFEKIPFQDPLKCWLEEIILHLRKIKEG
ncbi:MAG: hypothetical protein ACFFDS_09425 [Candidatus Thorarchaeota archaeon]